MRDLVRADLPNSPDARVSRKLYATATDSASSLLLRHMGLLVSDDENVGRFAGSTTGVHFVQLVEQALQSLDHPEFAFPEDCYRLHLTQRTRLHQGGVARRLVGGIEILTRLQHVLSHDMSALVEEVQRFLKVWSGLCPVLIRQKIEGRMSTVVHGLWSGVLADQDLPVLLQILLMMLMNLLTEEGDAQGGRDHGTRIRTLEDVILDLLPDLLLLNHLESLQTLCLVALYAQVTGRRIFMSQINGAMVPLAFSLGLHRHARRFKFSPGEVELRKRVWWFVYLYDATVAISLGLPKLIRDAYVDNDYPIDCELGGLDTIDISYPLPGESGAIPDFVVLVKLARIQDMILETLYTTTDRRDGVAKISKLQNDLNGWNLTHSETQPFIVGASHKSQGPGDGFYSSQGLVDWWIQLQGNLCLLLIHRPALTYKPEVPQFAKSFKQCMLASREIIQPVCEAPTSAISLAPCEVDLVFQAALVHVWYWKQFGEAEGDAAGDGVVILHQAQEVLHRLIPGANESFVQAVRNALATLQMLEQLFWPPIEGSVEGSVWSSQYSAPSDGVSFQQILESADTLATFDSLNDSGFEDWMFQALDG